MGQRNQVPISGALLYGSVPATIDHLFNYNDTGIGSAITLFSVEVPPLVQAVLLEVFCQIITPFNAATTNVITVGTSTTANEIMASGVVTAGTAGFYPSGYSRYLFTQAANPGATPIYFKYAQTGTAASAGQGRLFFKFTEFLFEPSI